MSLKSKFLLRKCSFTSHLTSPKNTREGWFFHSQPQTVVNVWSEKETPGEFPGSSVVRTPCFHCQRYPVGDLTSHKLGGMARKRNKQKTSEEGEGTCPTPHHFASELGSERLIHQGAASAPFPPSWALGLGFGGVASEWAPGWRKGCLWAPSPQFFFHIHSK